MTKDEKILKTYQKTVNEAATEIRCDSNGFYDIFDKNGNKLATGDLVKGTRGLGGMKSIK